MICPKDYLGENLKMKRMKKINLLCCLVMLLLSTHSLNAQENFAWKEMNNFHSTAMLSFHGAEDGRLQPTRDSAAAMLQKSTVWQVSGVPAGHDADAIKALLQKLVTECTIINNAVIANKTDAELKPLVLTAHHTFHAIIEKAK